MGTALVIPTSACVYVLLQRTAYQPRYLATLLRRFPRPISLAGARLVARLQRASIVSRFERGINRDFRSLKPYLPPLASSILDIGCGVAGIDALLYKHYGESSSLAFYLADFDTTSDNVHYGFGSAPAVYNSFTVTRELLVGNGVPLESLHFMQPQALLEPGGFPRFALVISTLAWGFHFPVEIYAQAVCDLMEDDGRLIMDLRTGTGGVEQLQRYFRVLDVVESTQVRQRIVAAPMRAA